MGLRLRTQQRLATDRSSARVNGAGSLALETFRDLADRSGRGVLIQAIVVSVSLSSAAAGAQSKPVPDNPAIDMRAFLRVSLDAADARESGRIPESDFIRMSREPGTIVLDARSREKFDELHVKGAINLSLPDIAVDSLQGAMPDKGTRILIYCNNNFLGADSAFPYQAAGGFAEPVDLHRALQLWVPKHL